MATTSKSSALGEVEGGPRRCVGSPARRVSRAIFHREIPTADVGQFLIGSKATPTTPPQSTLRRPALHQAAPAWTGNRSGAVVGGVHPFIPRRTPREDARMPVFRARPVLSSAARPSLGHAPPPLGVYFECDLTLRSCALGFEGSYSPPRRLKPAFQVK